VFTGTQRLISIRKQLGVVADYSNLTWITPHNIHVAGYIRSLDEKRLFGIFNFKDKHSYLTWYAFKEQGYAPAQLQDHWSGKTYQVGDDREHLVIPPYGFLLLEPV
jgi:amylosucrase